MYSCYAFVGSLGEKCSNYLFRTKDDSYGRFIKVNDTTIPIVVIGSSRKVYKADWCDIVEVMQSPSNYQFFSTIYLPVATTVWKKEEDYCFIGISNEACSASSRSTAANWASSKANDIKYYEDSMSCKENHKVIEDAKYYIAVTSMDHPYVLGMGLYKQMKLRMDLGKPVYVAVHNDVLKVNRIELLQNGTPKEYAVIFAGK